MVSDSSGKNQAYFATLPNDCAMWYVTDVLGKKWNMQIILELVNGINHKKQSLNFTELNDLIPDVNTRTLTQRLTHLQDAGIVERIASQKTPKKGRYKLTPTGMELIPIIDNLRSWSIKNGNIDNKLCERDLCRHKIGMNNFVATLL